MELKNLEQLKRITIEEGKELRQKIYEEAKRLFSARSNGFVGELNPEGSLTIFNANNEMTISSVVEVVERFLARSIKAGVIHQDDQENIEEFKEFLKSLKS